MVEGAMDQPIYLVALAKSARLRASVARIREKYSNLEHPANTVTATMIRERCREPG